METVNIPGQTRIAFINDKNLILELISNDLTVSGMNVLFRSENVEDGLARLSGLRILPEACIIDLDFYDPKVLAQLQKLKVTYPAIRLIAYSDKDSEKAVVPVLAMGFDSYLLVGCTSDDFKKAIKNALKNKKYFSTGIVQIAQAYFNR